MKLVIWIFAWIFTAGSAFAFDCTPWVYSAEQQSSSEPGVQKNAAFEHGLLWRVKGPSAGVSYLFGTIHLSDPRILGVAKRAAKKIQQTSNFAMEVLMTPEVAELSATRMFYPDAQNLSDHLSASLFKKTTTLLGRHGVGADAANKLRPWAAYMTLAVPPTDQGIPLDLHLLNIAKRNGSMLHGIETIDEQLRIFEQLARSAQVSLLTEAVCNYPENQAQIETMVALYSQEKLQELAAISERYQTPHNLKLLNSLLYERNDTMLKRIKPWLTNGDFFIAVGALHLVGNNGLLRALAGNGFDVTPVIE